ncbi:FAD/FMN-containing dehydrogenase [Herbaspirillum sp. Sphag1AN]|uniref:FAD-binding oxidoreductase n=1 Tax=unclassified Herbaspirillum TaxID=2624150 RepID=UPI0016183770|nr:MULTISPECIES: FAD-binding oxidoreductase [unclassified Herbaspirillum]MBB3211283.1 FAD/FMN-containing dehydrogenase [Herbaspirillum sp. Sphag1AN]MBB3244912.1 FAD/FMN-containing dehydrogenase [Herbaspirillum sp. Sphag64]
MNDFLQCCRNAIGGANVLTEAADTASYLTDQRGRFTGRALAVIKPGNTNEVAAIVKLCQQYQVPIVPQGGNTGLVLGSVPDTSGRAIVLSLTRLNRIRTVDPINNTMTVEAGCLLQQVQQAAADAGRLFPLSLAAEGSCTIGGNLSTNAGGTAVLRYGNTRELCLGLEVVTAQGDIMSSLRGLRKDNTGYALRDLFIGAEGTLGLITAAVLKLFPQPRAQVTALVALPSPEHALKLLNLAQAHCGSSLTGFELMSAFCLELVIRHFPQQRLPFEPSAQPSPHFVLLEISDSESAEHANSRFEDLIENALEEALVSDAVIATSINQSKALWQLRESISMAQAREGKNIKHDISVPISHIAEFIRVTDVLLQQAAPGCRMVTFGHLGDGNLHYNVSPPIGVTDTDFIAQQSAINRVVHDSVDRFHGSISAEHGLGALKRDEILRYKSPVELQLMRSIKQALDPDNLMNPGKVL